MKAPLPDDAGAALTIETTATGRLFSQSGLVDKRPASLYSVAAAPAKRATDTDYHHLDENGSQTGGRVAAAVGMRFVVSVSREVRAIG